MIVYFSGTGNSRWCAQMLAENLGDDLLDSASYIKHGIAADLISGNPWVFVAPTYAWQLPRVFEAFIRTGSFAGSQDAYFVMTCGGEIGNAGEKLEILVKDVGLTYKGVLQVNMPENYIAMFDVPGAEESKAMIRSAVPILEKGVHCIQQEQPFPPVKVGLIDRLKSGIVNQGFYNFYVNAKQFRTTSACTHCGKCAELCPLNNIRLQDGVPIWGDHCTHCMACICYCPAEAIEYGKHSGGKTRYRCEDYL